MDATNMPNEITLVFTLDEVAKTPMAVFKKLRNHRKAGYRIANHYRSETSNSYIYQLERTNGKA